MTSLAAVPFTLRRSTDLWTAGGEYESTTETAHGLVRLESDRLVIQWRVAVRTESLGGALYETREEIEPVQQMVIPLTSVAGAIVPSRRWWQLTGPRLVLTATDLLAFEKIAGQQGLKLKHPAKLVLRIKRADRLIADEFAAELALTLARQVGDGGGRASHSCRRETGGDNRPPSRATCPRDGGPPACYLLAPPTFPIPAGALPAPCSVGRLRSSGRSSG